MLPNFFIVTPPLLLSQISGENKQFSQSANLYLLSQILELRI